MPVVLQDSRWVLGNKYMSDALLCYLDLQLTLLKCTISAVSVDSTALGNHPALFHANLLMSVSPSKGSITQTNWTQ